MTPAISLKKDHIDVMIRHALEDVPNECCGLLGGTSGVIAEVYLAQNAEKSPYRFSIDFKEQRRLEEKMVMKGEELLGFYHSHTGSPARPSPTDIRMMTAFFGPPIVHFVVSVADRTSPDIRAFYIENGKAQEQEFAILGEG
jgi:proteasome lid subunit RPN8/RPN11